MREARAQTRVPSIFASQRLNVDIEDPDEDIEDREGDELEELEEQLVDEATSARTLAELEAEIATLTRLEARADVVRKSGVDKKWSQFLTVVGDEPEMFDHSGARRKLIVFTEHRDTLNYLVAELSLYLGKAEAVVAIQGVFLGSSAG